MQLQLIWNLSPPALFVLLLSHCRHLQLAFVLFLTCVLLLFLLPCADIMPGQGLYYTTLTQTWRARNCLVNSYGVSNQTYGLTPYACRECEYL